MNRPLYPALFPSLGFLTGTAFALHAELPSLSWLLLLLTLSFRLHRRVAFRFFLLLILGLISVSVRGGGPTPQGQGLVQDRPVTALVKLEGSWRKGDFGWSSLVRVKDLQQGETSLPWAEPTWLRIPDRDLPPSRGRVLRVRGFLGRSRGYLNRPRIPPSPWALRVKSRRLLEVVEPPGGLSRLSQWLRQQVSGKLELAVQQAPNSSALPWVRALVLGDAEKIPDRAKRALKRTGLAHLLAVSGLHVGLVALAVLIVTHRASRGVRIGATALAILIYLLLIGPRPSVLRASFMALLAMGSLLFHRPPAVANALALFAAAAAAWKPLLLLDLGFQLSVSATAGIVLISPWLMEGWRGLPPWLSRPLSATASAQLATFPFSIPVFHLWVPLAPLFNLLALPWASVVLTSFLLWTVLACTSPQLAALFVPALDLLVVPLSWLQALPASPWLLLPINLGRVAALGVAFALMVSLRRPKWGLVCVLALLVGQQCTVRTLLTQTGSARLTATLFDVGQGESILLRDGQRALLVDGGGWRRGDFAGRVLLPALEGEGVHSLEAVVMTHPDTDHCEGLVGIADYLPVGALWSASRFRDSDCTSRLLARGVSWSALDRGSTVEFGRWRLRVLHPVKGGSHGNDNDGSVVLRAEIGKSCLLLTGDIEKRSEAALLREDPEALSCQVLKVAHHGSKTSTSTEFLEAVSPRIAVLSAGHENSYGHPTEVVLGRLHRNRATIYRTDLHGRIKIDFSEESSPKVVSVEAWPGTS